MKKNDHLHSRYRLVIDHVPIHARVATYKNPCIILFSGIMYDFGNTRQLNTIVQFDNTYCFEACCQMNGVWWWMSG